MLEDLAFDRLLLGRRLDDEVAISEQRVVCAGDDTRHRRLLVGFADLAAADLANKIAIDRLYGPLERGGIDVAHPHIEARKRANMGDAAAHLAGADDADRLHHDRSNRLLTLRQLGVEFRHQLEEVADQAVIGNLKDRRFLILVDGDDDL